MKPYALYSIIGINVVMLLVTVMSGGDLMSPSSELLVELGGDLPMLTLNGQPWRLVTAMFLHGGLIHLALNMYCLYQGRVLESYYGRLGFAVLYLVAGLMGGLLSVFFADPHTVSIGASGAVFGVFGALFMVIYQRRRELGPALARAQLFSLLQFFGLNVVITFFVPQIDWRAHLGGLLGGAACAVVMRSQRDPDYKRRISIVGGAGVSLTALALLLMR